MSESILQKKLNKLIQRELSEILVREKVYVPGIMLTVSVVRITGDLSIVKVYISCLPESKLEETVTTLNENAWEVRFLLSKRIRNKLKKMPELRFYIDDSFQEAERIGDLLEELKSNESWDEE